MLPSCNYLVSNVVYTSMFSKAMLIPHKRPLVIQDDLAQWEPSVSSDIFSRLIRTSQYLHPLRPFVSFGRAAALNPVETMTKAPFRRLLPSYIAYKLSTSFRGEIFVQTNSLKWVLGCCNSVQDCSIVVRMDASARCCHGALGTLACI
jgi:hypothetical protein